MDFLDGPARDAGAVYIMGDLFEAWIGDDAPGHLGRRVARHLSALSKSGTSVVFLCGNRDFLIGDAYCRQAGMQRVEEPVSLDTGQGSILLMHGDTLCTDDESYQRFRRKSRDPRWQQRMLSKPIWVRRLLARMARWLSRRHTGDTEASIMDVNDAAVANTFREHAVRRLIHGHTHRPAIHDLRIDHCHCQRIVLGDWGVTGSTVRVDGESVAMLRIGRDSEGGIDLALQETAAPLVGHEHAQEGPNR